MKGGAVLLETHYMPCVAYFREILQYDLLVIDDKERFQKQTYRNRCRLLGPNGVDTLSVPVTSKRSPITKTKIDYSQGWKNQHTRAIQSYYGKAPYFEYYFELFNEIFSKESSLLFDLNTEFMTLCLRILGNPVEMTVLSEFEKTERLPLTPLKESINRKKDFNELPFSEYNQLFGKQFEKNLSILDLLFCEGPEAVAYLKFQ